MRKSIIEPANVLQEKLLDIPRFVTSFSSNEMSICDQWVEWLEDVENILKKHNYTQCAEIAGYRSLLIKKCNDGLTPSRSQKRKQKLQAAISTIQPVQQILSDKHDELQSKIDQVRLMMRQILIPAKDAGMIQFNRKTSFTDFIESLLLQLKRHEQIGHGINNAIATIGKYDVLRILAEEVEL